MRNYIILAGLFCAFASSGQIEKVPDIKVPVGPGPVIANPGGGIPNVSIPKSAIPDAQVGAGNGIAESPDTGNDAESDSGGGDPPISTPTVTPLSVTNTSDYFDSYNEAKQIMKFSGEITIIVTAFPENRSYELARITLARIEKEILDEVRAELAKQFAQLRKEAWEWDNEKKRAAALELIRQNAHFVNNLYSQARNEANRNVNQHRDEDNGSSPVRFHLGKSGETREAHVTWKEGTAMRQLRKAASDGFSSVLKDQ